MSNPINKGGAQPPRRLPQINNKVTIAALTAGAYLVRKLGKQLAPRAHPGQTQRFEARIRRALASTPAGMEAGRMGGIKLNVSVNSSFGKPTLVSTDIILTPTQAQVAERLGEKSPLLGDALERIAQSIWDNPEVCPAAVRGRICESDSNSDITLLDMKSIGFGDEIARPEELYKRFGPPAGDPRWRP
jgi:hypothetical protein